MNTVELNSINLQSIDVASNNVSSIGKSIKRNNKPYIKGHISTSDNTFTFSVNNTDVTINVDSNGNFKYKPTSTITSLSFVSVPELESLELFKINGVTTFDVDYPTTVNYIRCDSTTISAKNDVYHIRGTATEDFTFTLKYIDDKNTVTTVTESAVIDGNGKWYVAYSGKQIKDLNYAFRQNTAITKVVITEDMQKCTSGFSGNKGFFGAATNLVEIEMPNAIFDNIDRIDQFCISCTSLKRVYMPKAKFGKVTQVGYTFSTCTSLETIDFSAAVFGSLTSTANFFQSCSALKDLTVPASSTFNLSFNLSASPLTYNSMLRIAGWLKDLTGGTAQTVTFCKATYDALTAEQQATLQGIIVTQKNWILATA